MKQPNILSHIHPTKPPETLEEHKALTSKYLQKILDFQKIDLDRIVSFLDIDDKEFVKRLFLKAVQMHDEGKCNPAFQYVKMKNEAFKAQYKKGDSTKHSFLGAKSFFKTFANETLDDFEKKLFILLAFSFLIAKHHAKIDDFATFVEELKIALQEEGSEFGEFYENLEVFEPEVYIVFKLFYSLLISADYYATTQYMADLITNDFGKLDVERARQEFEDFEIVQNIRKHRFKQPINTLRSQMFQESEAKLLQNLDKNIFYLQAPTGAGKTLMSLNLALHTKPNKIFYVFPFNTLVEQTKERIDEIFSLESVVINSVTPIADEESDEKQYEKTYLNRLFYHYPLILTTHVNFFDILFGIGKESNFPLWQLYGSTVILDEIQSYDSNLWWYMVEFFQHYAKVLNMKIIIMSATLPKIDAFLENRNDFCELLEAKCYFQDPLFKERVETDFSLLDVPKEELFERLKEKIAKYDKVLVEFISKRSAREFYEYIKNDHREVYELTGDDNKLLRQFVIERTKKAQKIVVVATQVIEAGVDIDMEVGFKDIATIESEEQFMGRINRNAKGKGKVYFFDLDDASGIYKGDKRLAFSIKDEKCRQIFMEKEFQSYYEALIELLKRDGQGYVGASKKIEGFYAAVKRLEYAKIYKQMQLIKDQTQTIFLPYSIGLEGMYGKLLEGVDERFVENGALSGKRVWEELKALNEVENFAKNAVLKSKLHYYMQFFTYSVPWYVELSDYSDECCGMKLFEDFEAFIDEEYKFDRAAFLKSQKGEFAIW